MERIRQHPSLDNILDLAAQAWPEIASAARAELQALETMDAVLWAAIGRGAILANAAPTFERSADIERFLHALKILYRNH